MKVKLTSDGGSLGTRVVTESGEDISNRIQSVQFRHRAGNPPDLELELGFVETEIDGDAVMIGPKGRHVARIVYVDGTEDVFE